MKDEKGTDIPRSRLEDGNRWTYQVSRGHRKVARVHRKVSLKILISLDKGNLRITRMLVLINVEYYYGSSRLHSKLQDETSTQYMELIFNAPNHGIL